MPVMEAGLFALMGGSAFVLMLLSFKFGALLKALAAVLFFSLSVILLAGYEVAYTSETSGTGQCPTNDPCITQHFLVRQDDTSGETSGSWMAWVFIALGIMSSMLFIIEMIPR